MENHFIANSHKMFSYYKSLGEKSFKQLSDNELFIELKEDSNSIAIIVNHLSGNMKSRWTNFLTEDGEKSWRNRENEFTNAISTREELINAWESGWRTVFDALETINKENFETKILIRNIEHSIIEAVTRQMTHYAYHIGQIVFIAKILKGNNWETLSIAKGNSESYNKEKFDQATITDHFTDEFVKKK